MDHHRERVRDAWFDDRCEWIVAVNVALMEIFYLQARIGQHGDRNSSERNNDFATALRIGENPSDFVWSRLIGSGFGTGNNEERGNTFGGCFDYASAIHSGDTAQPVGRNIKAVRRHRASGIHGADLNGKIFDLIGWIVIEHFERGV